MARKKGDNVVVVIDVGGQNRGGVGRNMASQISELMAQTNNL
jgi:hypothetical protein